MEPEPDYYKILEIPRRANDAEIKKAYHKLALQFHPDKNTSPYAVEKFQKIDAAYKILSNPVDRKNYDSRHVPSNLNGPNNTSFMFKQYRYSGFDFGKYKDYDMTRELTVSLEEVFLGVENKVVTIKRKHSGRGQTVDQKTIYVDIKKGCKAGTKFTFPGATPSSPNTIPGDVTIVIKDAPHPFFKRSGNNIIYTCLLSLRKALCNVTIDIPLLMDRTMKLCLDFVVKPGYCHSIHGHGLPLPGDSEKRGCLIVKFVILFPSSLNENAQKMINDCLQNDPNTEAH